MIENIRAFKIYLFLIKFFRIFVNKIEFEIVFWWNLLAEVRRKDSIAIIRFLTFFRVEWAISYSLYDRPRLSAATPVYSKNCRKYGYCVGKNCVGLSKIIETNLSKPFNFSRMSKEALRTIFQRNRPRILTQPTQLKIFKIFLKSQPNWIRPKFLYPQIQRDSLNLLRCLHPFFIFIEKNLLLGIQSNYNHDFENLE